MDFHEWPFGGLNHIWVQYCQISSLFKVGDIWRRADLWSFLKLNWSHQPAKMKTHLLVQVKDSLWEQWALKEPSQLLRAQLDSIIHANSPVEGSKWGLQIIPQMQVQKGSEPNLACSKDRAGTTVHPSTWQATSGTNWGNVLDEESWTPWLGHYSQHRRKTSLPKCWGVRTARDKVNRAW